MYSYAIGICIVFFVHEFTKLYTSVKNQELKAKILEIEPDSDETDKNLIIYEQRKIIEQLKTTNSYNKLIAKHYRKLYLWRKNNV